MITIDEIFDSYVNGQKKQSAIQIQEYGPVRFAYDLDDYDTSEDMKFDILQNYIIQAL